MKAIWCRTEEGIGLRPEGGQVRPVSALEVFQTQFGRTRTVQGFEVASPSADLPNLRFSRFPAKAAVRVAGSPYQLDVEVGVLAGKTFALPFPGRDQIVVDDEWFPIQQERVAELGQWIRENGGVSGRRGTIGTLIALRTRAELPGQLIDEVDERTESSTASETGDLIPGLCGELYPYQVEGVRFLRMIASQGIGCVLADEMGLGKTLQVIALLQSEKNEGRGQALVVAPATLLENWRRELQVFAPDLSVLVHAGAERPGIAEKLAGFDVVVVSYETAMRDEPLLGSIRWNVLALDEAQNIKNPEAQRALTVKRFPRRVSIAVTGTPLENRLDDLWSITDFSLPGLLGDLGEFRKQYAHEMDDAGKLGALIAPAVLRRRVLEVAKDLPARIDIPQPLRMTRSLAEAYERLRLEVIEQYGPTGNLVAMGQLRMLCAHPSLVTTWALDPAFEMPKFLRLQEILEEVFAVGEKALVFSTYTGMADLFMREFPARFPNGFFRFIDGRVPVVDRQPTVDSFFDADMPGALFLNPKAAGTGLNITTANHVIHYNPEWNPALTDQATARAYRRKQIRPVTVHSLYFLETVEEIIVDRAEFKRQLAGEAVTGNDGDVEPAEIAEAMRISPLASFGSIDS